MNEEFFVGHYGIHFHGDTPYLHQSKDGQGVDALGGDSASPFRVTQRGHSPHAIDLGFAGSAPALQPGFLNNPLVDFYLPKPVFSPGLPPSFIEADSLEAYPVLRKLAHLSSLNDDSVRWWTPKSEGKVESDLRLTNLAPLTLLGWSPPETNSLYTIITMAAAQRRKLLLVAEKYVPVPDYLTNLTSAYGEIKALVRDVSEENMRAAGNLVFKNFIKKLAESYA